VLVIDAFLQNSRFIPKIREDANNDKQALQEDGAGVRNWPPAH
jgi:hypothetical protein